MALKIPIYPKNCKKRGHRYTGWLLCSQCPYVGKESPAEIALFGWKFMQFLPRLSQWSHCEFRLSTHSSQVNAPENFNFWLFCKTSGKFVKKWEQKRGQKWPKVAKFQRAKDLKSSKIGMKITGL